VRAVAAVGVFALVATLAPASAALAHAAKKSKSAVVVQVVDRAPYGEMLATTTGLSLYTGPPCTGNCLVIWPPLLMPKGKKTPLGESGLGTVKVKMGRHKVVQVTYNGEPLYRFYTDTGTAVGGEGVGGFVVAAATTASLNITPSPATFPSTPPPYSPMPIVSVTINDTSGHAISSIVVNPVGVYSVPSSTCTTTLMPGQSCTAQVQFCPSSPGNYVNTLVVTGRDVVTGSPLEASITLDGTAT
jgi:predicted lipoprotein with Yx(FWY)xxD motif